MRSRYPWVLVNLICLFFLVFLCTRTLTLVVGDCWFKIEEIHYKMAFSSKNCQVEQKNHAVLANWSDRALSSQHLRRVLVTLFVHLCITVSLPPFQCALWSAFGLHRKFLYSLTPPQYACCISIWPCPKHNARIHSLYAGALQFWHSLSQ